MDPENQNKSEYLLKLLEEGDAMVCLDARHPAVDVPASHKENPMLNLVFNLNFRRPFEVLEDGIYSTLAFNQRPHKCVIPFEAIWAIYVPDTQAGQVWENSIPEDLDLEEQTLKTKDNRKVKTTPRAKLAVTPTAQNKEEPAEGAPQSGGKPRRDRSHLRVIK